MAEYETRCCATCGFMGLKRLRGGSGPLHEADESYRKTGQCDYGIYEGAPHCHKADADLPAETSEACRSLTDGRSGNGHNPAAVLQVFQTPRHDCRWFEWHPGYHPKEHDKMLAEQLAADVQRAGVQWLAILAGLQRDFLALKKEQDEWIKRQAENEERTSKRLYDLEGRRHWQSVFWNAFSAVVSAGLASWLTWYLTRSP